ncbi:uncharacterized protein CCR75_006002 [Bremia lactucae]|uniref:Lipoprotein n=1 Tax=Bremia lactucae TaxID=4779 RepID=A0A976IGX1_BRELC|nr:hypothetical protein CCR75_006002 [Bremia lactucae]
MMINIFARKLQALSLTACGSAIASSDAVACGGRQADCAGSSRDTKTCTDTARDGELVEGNVDETFNDATSGKGPLSSQVVRALALLPWLDACGTLDVLLPKEKGV